MTDRLDAALALIDQANEDDPNNYRGTPLALTQGRRASAWLAKLTSEPSEELQIAARAHHLKRWELERSAFPEGRAGYLNWRRTNKKHQAASATKIMTEAGYDETACVEVTQLLLRRNLGQDPQTQLLEDVACLVFVETQLDDVANKLDTTKMVEVVAKTLKKMSPQAIESIAIIPINEKSQQILTAAINKAEA